MIDFEHGNKLALPNIMSWIPGGEIQGDEYVVKNPTRNDKTPGSFKINLNTGMWIENASGEGGDAVGLRAYLDGSGPKEAFDWIIAQYDPTYFAPFNDGRAKNKNPANYWEGFRFCHKSHRNPPELNTSYYQKKFGPEIERWPIKIKVGNEYRPIMWIVRFSDGSSKDDRPFTLWTDGYEYKWRAKAAEGKYPLYGLEALESRPNAPVLLTEGQKKASRAEKVLDGWACVGWYGGASNIGLTDLEPLRGREIWFPFDADIVGRSVLKKLAEFEIKVHPVYPPLNVEKGWDIADAIVEGWDKAKIEDWLYNSAKVPEVQANRFVDTARDWEAQDYIDNRVLHRIFLDEKCGQDSFFVHNETGYMWDKKRYHWVVHPIECMVEEFQQWALDDNSDLVVLARNVNMGATKASDKIFPEIMMRNSISYLKRYRGTLQNLKLGTVNPFSNVDGVRPYWHFQNGMLEIKDTGVVWYPRDSHPELFFMNAFPLSCMEFNYNPDETEAPHFMSTIRRLMPDGYKDDPKSVKFILQCFAYSLLPKKMKPYYFICHGKQGSGKSSLVQVLKELAGGYFVSKQCKDIFSRFGKPGLVGKLIVCDDDVSDDYVLPTEIKTLSNNTESTIEEKGKPQYQAVMNVAPWIIGNRPPRTTGSDGHDRRAVVMYFSSTEGGDPHHMDKMFGRLPGFKDERPAILNMVLQVIPEFVQTWKFDRPEWAMDNHKEWVSSSNSVASYFSENKEHDADTWYPRAAVYRHYSVWSELSGLKPVSADVFYKALPGEGIETKKTAGKRQICCPFTLPDLDREELRIMKTDQFGVKKYNDKVPF